MGRPLGKAPWSKSAEGRESTFFWAVCDGAGIWQSLTAALSWNGGYLCWSGRLGLREVKRLTRATHQLSGRAGFFTQSSLTALQSRGSWHLEIHFYSQVTFLSTRTFFPYLDTACVIQIISLLASLSSQEEHRVFHHPNHLGDKMYFSIV